MANNSNEKCRPDCLLYNKDKPYQEQTCIHLHKMYWSRDKKIREEDKTTYKSKDVYLYKRKRWHEEQELVFNTSICYSECNKKKIDKRKRSDVPIY